MEEFCATGKVMRRMTTQWKIWLTQVAQTRVGGSRVH
jgi:hypothetical protein